MNTVEKIRELAADSKTNIGDLLRQCHILANRISEPAFEEWVDHELNGYRGTEEGLPDYRKGPCHAHGNFLGDFYQKNDVPLPSAALKPQHRRWASRINLVEPIAVYADLLSDPKRQEFVFQWPANLIALYQSAFFGPDYLLQQAWQQVSRGQLLAVVETVRNRVLKFVLELEKQVPSVQGSSEPLPAKDRETVTQLFQTIINGNVGNIATGGTNVQQTATVTVGDLEALRRVLSEAGVDGSDILEIETALKEDGSISDRKFGPKTSGLLSRLYEKALSAGGQVAISTAGTIIPKLIGQYLGLPPG